MNFKLQEQISITDGNGQLEQTTYILVKMSGKKAFVVPQGQETSNVQPLEVHKSRLRKLGEQMAAKESSKKKVNASEFIEEKMNELGEGSEHWVKEAQFNQESVRLVCHIIISGEKDRFVAFNTYNENFGRKGPTAKEYELKDYEKKVKKMTTDGYSQK